jgi:hypothetical protein
MNINQFYIQGHWEPGIEKNLLTKYSNVNEPAFFYSTLSLDYLLKNHLGPAVLIVNNNILPIERNIEAIRLKKDLYFISTSKLMSNYLDFLKLSYVEFPWGTHTLKPIAQTKGNSVYFYGDASNRNLYGYHIISKIMKEHFPHLKLIATCHPLNQPLNNGLEDGFISYDKKELDKIYRKVFIGIRLTRFDGGASTVQDLGLRGIKCVWNGGSPSALSYSSEEDIINHIKNEEKTIGSTDNNISNRCKDFLDITNVKYKYMFDLTTYQDPINSPKLFKNSKPLTVELYNNWWDERYNLNKKLKV